jgi:hypothetical protein
MAGLRPDAGDPLYVFHVFNCVNKLIVHAALRLRTAASRRGKDRRNNSLRRKGDMDKADASRSVIVHDRVFRAVPELVKRPIRGHH